MLVTAFVTQAFTRSIRKFLCITAMSYLDFKKEEKKGQTNTYLQGGNNWFSCSQPFPYIYQSTFLQGSHTADLQKVSSGSSPTCCLPRLDASLLTTWKRERFSPILIAGGAIFIRLKGFPPLCHFIKREMTLIPSHILPIALDEGI